MKLTNILNNDENKPDRSICLYEKCPERSKYDKCFLHTYILCDGFINFYNSLDREERARLLR